MTRILKQKICKYMKFQFISIAVISSLFVLLFSGCVKDKCTQTQTFTIMEPVYMDYETFRNTVASEAPRDIEDAGKIYLYKNYFFLNEKREGVHIFDISDPGNPTNVGFIKILGNVDIAIKNDVLIADSFMDLVSIDISDPLNVREVGRVNEIYERNWANGIVTDGERVVVDWIGREQTTEVDCNAAWFGGRSFFNTGGNLGAFDEASSSAPSGTTATPPGTSGQAGSFARFSIVNSHLYVIDNRDMYVFDIASPSNPYQIGEGQNIGWNIETLYPYKDHLFIGSQSGMFVYDVSNDGYPTYVSEIQHFQACDPVVVEGDYAYVTLRNGSECNGFENQLDVVDISNISNLKLAKSYDMHNPHGLGVDDGTLFICDGSDGLKIYDSTDPLDLKLIRQYDDIVAIDVIPANDILFTVTTDGFNIYDYSSVSKIKLLSSIRTN